MKRYFYISILSILALFSIGCSTTPVIKETAVNPTEMYAWIPPDEYELELRKDRQETLVSISSEVESLYLNQQDLNNKSQAFGSTLRQSIQKTESLENDLQARIQFQKLQQEQLKKELDKLNLSHNFLKSRLTTLEAVRSQPIKKFSKGDYTAAINYLKDGKLKQSMHKFNVALQANPPIALKDNIHFGLASVYYKLRKYSEAIKHLEAVRKHFPKGDKWMMSHVMLGIIHNKKGEKSRALYILNQALEKNPPDSIKRTIDLMMKKIQEENRNVKS
ncbi:MAG: tetratricopeptide repeat protein [Nitrospinae bacterium]|jgi:TolA-binding protein|nr:tetratricopeptide repeat protein [Nitrospinota bacterium]MDA1108348.1 tetratricopeptide repeat protein [Nitrospinota bacterium]